MPCCVIKFCRNYKGRLKTTHNVTYHRIPNDPIMKSRWVDIIRRSRGDELWKPAKTTVICSDHFQEKYMYFVHNQERRRLKKEAIPSKALFLSSVKSDESENSDEDKGLPSEAVFVSSLKSEESENSDEDKGLPSKALFVSSMKSDKSENCDEDKALPRKALFVSSRKSDENENCDEDKALPSKALSTSEMQSYESENFYENMALPSKKSLAPEEDSSAAVISRDIQPSTSDKNEDPDIGHFSDLDSILDTPKEAKLRKELHNKIVLQKKHTLIIQSLRRQNLRLKKKIAALKNKNKLTT